MIIHPHLEQLRSLTLKGMAQALEEQLQCSTFHSLSFEERLGLLIDRERLQRDNRRLIDRLRKARLKQQACLEELDYHSDRELDKSVVLKLAGLVWIKDHHNLLITGSTGTGKSYLACAFGHKACLEGYQVRYIRVSQLFRELALSKADGRYHKLLTEFSKTNLLILDDFGLSPLTAEQRRDLLEIIDDRHQSRATIITSQVPANLWHDLIGDATLADAIMDRLIHNAYQFNLKGDSMRKKIAEQK